MNDGKKRRPQKHQNKTAYKIKFDTLALDIQKKVSLNLLCKRCSEQISWKLQFNKYKKITQPSKCNYCHEKIVVRSYMKACDPCAEKEEVCPKCLGKDIDLPQGDEVKLSAKEQAKKDQQEEKAMNEYIDSLKERSRRKVKRQYQKGIITWDNEHKHFVDQEGNQLVGLKFKSKGLDDLEKEMEEDFDDDFMDEDQDEDGSEQRENETKQNKKKEGEEQENKEHKQIGEDLEDNDQDYEGSQDFDEDQQAGEDQSEGNKNL